MKRTPGLYRALYHAVGLVGVLDEVGHKMHLPHVIQRPLCDAVDIRCGATKEELRRERKAKI